MLVPPIFGMTMLTLAILLIMNKVIVMRTEKNHGPYRTQPQLLMPHTHTSPSITEG
jgi:hypothetical protein